MAQYLQALSPEQLDAANVNQYLRNQKIIALTLEDYPDFVEELKKSLTLFATDERRQQLRVPHNYFLQNHNYLEKHRREEF